MDGGRVVTPAKLRPGVELRFSRAAAKTPAWHLITEGHNQLAQDGFADTHGGFPTAADDRVIYAVEAKEEVVGVLCYRHDTLQELFAVSLCYVEPSSRRLGVCRKMWAELRARAAEAGNFQIECIIFGGNIPAIAVMEKLGAKAKATVFSLDSGVES